MPEPLRLPRVQQERRHVAERRHERLQPRGRAVAQRDRELEPPGPRLAVRLGDGVALALYERPKRPVHEPDVRGVSKRVLTAVHELDRDVRVRRLDEAFHQTRGRGGAVIVRRVRRVARCAEAADEEDDATGDGDGGRGDSGGVRIPQRGVRGRRSETRGVFRDRGGDRGGDVRPGEVRRLRGRGHRERGGFPELAERLLAAHRRRVPSSFSRSRRLVDREPAQPLREHRGEEREVHLRDGGAVRVG
mmetsp:Transcript_8470/g.31000  ORF Transcript_8470/g.31000 Transcript_8470/m.31000 type:complete len:247 (-) Transcript_8470:1346-2086(-)